MILKLRGPAKGSVGCKRRGETGGLPMMGFIGGAHCQGETTGLPMRGLLLFHGGCNYSGETGGLSVRGLTLGAQID